MSERIHTDHERVDSPPPEEETLPAGGDETEEPEGSQAGAESRLAAAEAEAAGHLSHLQRLAAEFDNFRKRVARDQNTVLARANERLVKELLPIVDDLERALEAADTHDEAKVCLLYTSPSPRDS